MACIFSCHSLLTDCFAPFIRVHGHLYGTNDYRRLLITCYSSLITCYLELQQQQQQFQVRFLLQS